MVSDEKTPKREHQKHWSEQWVNVSVIIVSDSLSRLNATERKHRDRSSPIIRELLVSQEYFLANLLSIEYCPDEVDRLSVVMEEKLGQKNPPIHWIIFSGGTGISPRDVTIEAIRPFLRKELPGFGELFRMKTYEQVGTVAIMTRALAGVTEETLVTCLPGSPNAVRLGLELIIPEVKHVLGLLYR